MRRFWIFVALCSLLPVTAQAQTVNHSDIRSLKPEARKALEKALTSVLGEYAGVALYAKTVQKFGSLPPFYRLLREQIKRRSDLQALCRNYVISYPENPYLKRAKAPSSLRQAAQAGIQLTEGNIALYEKLLPDVAEYADVTRVFRRLQSESRDVLLPILKAAEAGGGIPPQQPTKH